MNWIIDNKDWLFSGIAIAVPIALIGWFFVKKQNKQNNQTQQSGTNSTNIQVGGNIEINSKKNNNG